MRPANKWRSPARAAVSTSHPAARNSHPAARRSRWPDPRGPPPRRANRIARSLSLLDRWWGRSRRPALFLPTRRVSHYQIECPADVGFQRFAGPMPVAMGKGCDHLDMKVGSAPLAAVESFGCNTQVRTELQPQAFDDWQQNSRAGAAIDREMEGTILLGAGFGHVLRVRLAL